MEGKENSLYELEKVRCFQRLCNRLSIGDDEGQALAEDNILGLKTISCIPRMPMLSSGSSGPAVEFLQEALGAEPVDGIFGLVTKQCVIEFQRESDLDADGIVGQKTWGVLVRK